MVLYIWSKDYKEKESNKLKTHAACDWRMRKYGGEAQCCYCLPHKECTINPLSKEE